MVGNPPDAAGREWVELQGFAECDNFKEAAAVQTYPIRVEATVISARRGDATGHSGKVQV